MMHKIAIIGIVTILWSGCSVMALRFVMDKLDDILERISTLDTRIYKLDWDLGKTEIMVKMIRENLTENDDEEEQ